MITSDLWDLNDLNVSVEDRKIANIRYHKDVEYVRSSDRRELEVRLNLIDALFGRKITDKVMYKLKELTAKLEKENEELKDLIKWEEDFNKKNESREWFR
jgi:hypothetical protein